MYLTHIGEDGQDSPAILIENATAANRTVNIPEFLNIAPDGLLRIDAPAADYYRSVDAASELLNIGRYEASLPGWREAVELEPGEAPAHNSLGVALTGMGRIEDPP